MHDVFSQSAFALDNIAVYKVQNLLLFPQSWAGFRRSIKLHWNLVRFSPEHAKDVPKDAGGVYSFVVQPGIADHPACSYLLYVGKTKRNFRVRYQEYLAEQRASDNSRRLAINGMLSKWNGYLWFCYAPISSQEKIAELEDALLAAYLPPFNKNLPGKLNWQRARVFGD